MPDRFVILAALRYITRCHHLIFGIVKEADIITLNKHFLYVFSMGPKPQHRTRFFFFLQPKRPYFKNTFS